MGDCQKISPSAVVQQKLIAYAKNCVEPALNYFKQQLTLSLKVPLAAFKASQLFNPDTVELLNPDSSSVNALSVIPFFSEEEIAGLKKELPRYLGKIAAIESDESSNVDCLMFWKNSASILYHCGLQLLRRYWSCSHLQQPLKEFSMLNNAFKDQQHNSLQDYLEASIMLRYNNCKNK